MDSYLIIIGNYYYYSFAISDDNGIIRLKEKLYFDWSTSIIISFVNWPN